MGPMSHVMFKFISSNGKDEAILVHVGLIQRRHNASMSKSFGSRIRAARNIRRLTQAALGKSAGIAQPRLSQIERDLRQPSAGERVVLERFLQMQPSPPTEPLSLPALPKSWRVSTPARQPRGEKPFSARLYACRQTYGELVEAMLRVIRARPDVDLCFEFLEQADMDSALECFAWLGLLAKGAKPFSAAMTRLGFQNHRLVDPASGLNVTHARWPCLEVNLEHCKLALFPQPTVDVRRAYYRLDALVSVRGRKGRFWVDLEIDGQGHCTKFDLNRQQALQLHTIRLTAEELEQRDLLELLSDKLAPLLSLADAG
jgi:transcriptional regulator with XRE-family HTH domain